MILPAYQASAQEFEEGRPAELTAASKAVLHSQAVYADDVSREDDVKRCEHQITLLLRTICTHVKLMRC